MASESKTSDFLLGLKQINLFYPIFFLSWMVVNWRVLYVVFVGGKSEKYFCGGKSLGAFEYLEFLLDQPERTLLLPSAVAVGYVLYKCTSTEVEKYIKELRQKKVQKVVEDRNHRRIDMRESRRPILKNVQTALRFIFDEDTRRFDIEKGKDGMIYQDKIDLKSIGMLDEDGNWSEDFMSLVRSINDPV